MMRSLIKLSSLVCCAVVLAFATASAKADNTSFYFTTSHNQTVFLPSSGTDTVSFYGVLANGNSATTYYSDSYSQVSAVFPTSLFNSINDNFFFYGPSEDASNPFVQSLNAGDSWSVSSTPSTASGATPPGDFLDLTFDPNTPVGTYTLQYTINSYSDSGLSNVLGSVSDAFTVTVKQPGLVPAPEAASGVDFLTLLGIMAMATIALSGRNIRWNSLMWYRKI